MIKNYFDIWASNNILTSLFTEEIQRIPTEKLSELYDIIHLFRIKIEKQAEPEISSDNIMRFAGCWKDMSDNEFDAFLIDSTNRRKTAFSGRKKREAFFS